MRIRVDKIIVPYKATAELIAAGVPVRREIALLKNNGVEISLENEDDASLYKGIIETVLDAHDEIDDIALIEDDAKQRLKAIPNWATWTEEQAVEWFTTHINNLAIPDDVKSLLADYGRMLLALRDKTFPNLE